MVTLKQCNINKQITENVTSNTLQHITADKYEGKKMINYAMRIFFFYSKLDLQHERPRQLHLLTYLTVSSAFRFSQIITL